MQESINIIDSLIIQTLNIEYVKKLHFNLFKSSKLLLLSTFKNLIKLCTFLIIEGTNTLSTGLQIDDKQSVCYINNFLQTYITKDYLCTTKIKTGEITTTAHG